MHPETPFCKNGYSGRWSQSKGTHMHLFFSFQYLMPLSTPYPTMSTAWSTWVSLQAEPLMIPPW